MPKNAEDLAVLTTLLRVSGEFDSNWQKAIDSKTKIAPKKGKDKNHVLGVVRLGFA